MRETQNMQSQKYRSMLWTFRARCQSRYESTRKPYTSRLAFETEHIVEMGGRAVKKGVERS